MHALIWTSLKILRKPSTVIGDIEVVYGFLRKVQETSLSQNLSMGYIKYVARESSFGEHCAFFTQSSRLSVTSNRLFKSCEWPTQLYLRCISEEWDGAC